jgi:YaiO family outer membrane protein
LRVRPDSRYWAALFLLIVVSAAPDLALAGTGKPEPTAIADAQADQPDDTPRRSSSLYAYGTLSQTDFGSATQDWQLAAIGFAGPLSHSMDLNAQITEDRRDTRHSTLAMVRLDRRVGDGWTVHLGATAGFGDPFRENWGLRAGVRKNLAASVTATFDARIAGYSLPSGGRRATAVSTSTGIELRPRGLGVELIGQWMNIWGVDGSHGQGASVVGRYYLADRDYLFAGAASYPETESGVTRRMKSAHVGIRHGLGKRTSFRLTFEHNRFEGAYSQNNATLGLELAI